MKITKTQLRMMIKEAVLKEQAGHSLTNTPLNHNNNEVTEEEIASLVVKAYKKALSQNIEPEKLIYNLQGAVGFVFFEQVIKSIHYNPKRRIITVSFGGNNIYGIELKKYPKLAQSIQEAVIKEQSQVGLRTSLANVMKYLIKRQNSAVGQSEFYEIETHIETLKKLAEAL